MSTGAMVRCTHCGGTCDWSATRHKEFSRARQFAVFASALALVGVALQRSGVAIWPWWLYGSALFVASQSVLKWFNGCWRVCRVCHQGQRGFRN